MVNFFLYSLSQFCRHLKFQLKNVRNFFLFSFCFIFSDGARHPTRTYSDIAVFGTLPPKTVSYSDFCPPPNCPAPNCDEHRCNNAYIHHHDIEIRQLHFKSIRFPGITNRTFGMCALCISISCVDFINVVIFFLTRLFICCSMGKYILMIQFSLYIRIISLIMTKKINSWSKKTTTLNREKHIHVQNA